MPNANTPFGLRPVQHRNGAAYNGSFKVYYIPAAYATALFVGDPVVRTGAVNTAATGSYPVGSLPVVAKATAGTTNPIHGVIVGFVQNGTTMLTYNPASTERLAMVCDDPDILFEIQAGGTLTPADVGLNACVIYTQSGSTITGKSGVELDTTSAVPATTVGFQLKIKRFVNRDDNDMAASQSKVLVTINTAAEAPATVGI
jgi:hypothetical protein